MSTFALPSILLISLVMSWNKYLICQKCHLLYINRYGLLVKTKYILIGKKYILTEPKLDTVYVFSHNFT